MQAGGARTLASGIRTLSALVAGGEFALRQGAGEGPALVVRAEDGASTTARTTAITGTLGSAVAITVNDAVIERRGTVSALLGGPLLSDTLATFVTLEQAGASARVSAIDGRAAVITAPNLTGNLAPGLTVGVQTSVIDDNRAVSAVSRDVLVRGAGRLLALAERSGHLRIATFAGDLSPFGLASARTNIALIGSYGAIRAQILGTRRFTATPDDAPTPFGGFGATALDRGNLEAVNVELGFTGNALGASITDLRLAREVRAEVGDSDTRIMFAPVSGAVRATASATGTVTAPSAALTGAWVADAEAIIALVSSVRDVVAGVGGPVRAGSVAIEARRAETLQLSTVEVSAANFASVSGRVGLIRQGGATEARLVASGGTQVSGDTTVSAQDDSTIHARVLALNAALGGVGGSGDVLFLDIGGGDALRPDEAPAAAQAQAEAATAARREAMATVDNFLPRISGTTNPLAFAAPSGSTVARIEGADLAAVTAGGMGLMDDRQRASFGGAVTASASTATGLDAVIGTASGGATAGVMAGLALVRRGTATRAEVDTTLTQGLQAAGMLTVGAVSSGSTAAAAFGVGGGGTAGVGASLAITLDRRLTRATLGGMATARAAMLSADGRGDVVALALPVAGAGTAAVGVGLALAIDDRTVRVRADRAQLTTTDTAGDILLRARATGQTQAISFGAALAGTAGVSVAQAYALRTGTTEAVAADSTLVAGRLLDVHALTDDHDGLGRPGVASVVISVGGGGTAGVAPAFSAATWRGTTLAALDRTTATARSSATVEARANADVESFGVGAAAGGSAGVAGTLTGSYRTDDVTARITGGSLVVQGSVGVVALSATGSDSFGGATEVATDDPAEGVQRSTAGARLAALNLTVAFGGQVGVGLTSTVTEITNRVTALIDGGAQVTARALGFSIRVPAFEVSADRPRTGSNRLGVVVAADSLVEQRAVNVTAGAGALGGVALQLSQTRISDTVTARIGGDGARTTVTAQNTGSVGVQAQGSIVLRGVSAGVGGGGTAGAGAVLTTLTVGRRLTALIDNATVTSGRMVRVATQSSERFRLLDVAGGGGLYAGVAGALSVVHLASTLESRIARATISAVWDLTVSAELDRDLSGSLVGAGLGAGVGSAGVLTLSARDRLLAEVADGDPALPGSETQALVRNVDVIAQTDQTIGIVARSLALGIGALQGTVAVVSLDTDVRARIGAQARIGSETRRAQVVNVAATTAMRPRSATGEMLTIGQAALTGATWGAGIAVLSARSVTEAEVASGARLVTTGGVGVTALTDRRLATGVGAFNLAVGGAVQVLAGFTLVGDRTGGADDLSFALAPVRQMAGFDLAAGIDGPLLGDGVTTDDDLGRATEAIAAAGQLAGAVIDNSALPTADADRTVARVGPQAEIDAQGSIGVIATDLTEATVRGGGVGVGLFVASALAGEARVRVNSTVQALVQSGAILRSHLGQIDVLASVGNPDPEAEQAVITRARSVAGVGGLGLAVLATDAFARTSRAVAATLATGSLTQAALGVSVVATTLATTEAEATGVALGLVAASGLLARAEEAGQTLATVAGTVAGPDLVLQAVARGAVRAETDARSLSLTVAAGVLGGRVTETSGTIARLTGVVAGAGTGGGRVVIAAVQARDATAQVQGLSRSLLLGIGGSQAQVTAARTVLAEVGASARLAADSLVMRAGHQGALSARAFNGGGALGSSALGSDARVALTGGATTRLQSAQLAVEDATLEARSVHTLDAEADSRVLGVVGAGGAARAEATAGFGAAVAIEAAGAARDRLFATAGMIETLTPSATAAAGALGVGLGSDAAATSTSASTVALGGGLTVGALRLATEHLVRFGSLASSEFVAALGRGGARSGATITAASGVTLTGGQVVARSVLIDAASRLIALRAARPAIAGSGGGAAALGASAVQTVGNTAAITLAPGARLTQSGEGSARLAVTAEVELLPSAQITATNVAAVPRAEAVGTAVNAARVALGADARLAAAGAVEISTRTLGLIDASAHADATAAVTSIGAEATATYTADEQITLAPGARIDGAGSVRLATGGAADLPSRAEVGALATFRSSAVLPLDLAPRSTVGLTLTSRVGVAGGAQVNAGGALQVLTRRIAADALARGRGRNLWVDFANTGLDWIGTARDIEIDAIEAASLIDDTGARIDGVLASGVAARVYLRLDAEGRFRAGDGTEAPILAPGDLPVPVTVETIGAEALRASILADLAARRAALEAAGSFAQAALLDLQIADANAQLDLLVARSGGAPIEVVRFGDIAAEGADIVISGGYLTGTGQLRPTADPSVTLRVERANAITFLGNIRVPDQPGRVLFNGLPVNSSAAVAEVYRDIEAQLLRDRAFEIGPDPFVIGGIVAPPALTFASAAATQGARVEVTALNDLYAAGDITNRAGLVRLALPPTGAGTLVVQGTITAQTVELVAPNVVVGYRPGLRTIAGDPQAMLFDWLDAPDLLANEVAPLAAVTTDFTPAQVRQARPAILAQNVSVYGEHVNINGRIEAGGPEMSVVLGAGVDAWITTVLLPSLTAASPERVLIHNPLSPADGSGISGNIAVYYNTRTDRIEFDPIVAQGGQVRIAGNLISTGNGEIVVLDGFSRITVTSASTRVHRFDAVDTGGEAGVQGRVELIDLRSGTRTVYSGVDTILAGGAIRRDVREQVFGIEVHPDRIIDLTGTLRSSRTILAHPTTGARSASYQIRTLNGLVPFVDYTVTATHTGNAQTATRRIVSSGVVAERALEGSAFYSYSRSPAQSVQPFGVYDHRHSFRANEPVRIGFVGERTGNIAIDAGGTVELTGLVRSEGAGLSIAAGGAILGRGPAAEVRGAQIGLTTRSAAAIAGAALDSPATTFRLAGQVVSVPGLLGQGLNLSELLTLGTLTATAPMVQAPRTSRFGGLTLRPEAPDLPLLLHVTAPRNGIAAGVTAQTGTTAGAARGNIALEARETALPLTRIDGRRVSLAARGSILAAGATGAGPNGLEIRATRGLTLGSAAGAIGEDVRPIRFATGDGRLDASARGSVHLAHDPNAPFAQGTLRVGQIESRLGSVVLTSRGQILDDNGGGARNRVTEEAALAAFWQGAGLLGPEREARIAAEQEAQRASRQADVDLYWGIRERFGGDEPSKAETDALFDQIAEAAVAVFEALGRTPAEAAADAAAEAANLRDTYERGRAESRRIDPAATRRPTVTVTLTDAERNAIAAELELTAADLDVALRRDYVVTTTATELDVETPNIIAAGNVRLTAATVGENRLVARVLTALSNAGPTPAGATDYRIDSAIPRELLVLLATTEPADYRRRGFPANSAEIWRADDIDLSVGGQLTVTIHPGLHHSVDASAYLGSEGGLTLDRIEARNNVRIKTVGDILAGNDSFGITGQAIILEAQRGSLGTAARPIRLDAGALGGAVDADSRAGGTAEAPGQIFLRRATAGDLMLGGVVATGRVEIAVDAGNLLARNTATLIEAATLALRASGRIGTRVGTLNPANRPIHLRTSGPLIAEAGTGLTLVSDRTLTARSVGSLDGFVDIQVTEGDLQLDGARADPTDPASLQIAPALFASPVIPTGAQTGQNDLLVFLRNGRILDIGSDATVLNQGTAFSVPDIRAGRLVLMTADLGTAANPVEADLGWISGSAGVGGIHLRNDRRQQPPGARGLTVGSLDTPGMIDITQRDALSLAAGATITAGGGLRLAGTGTQGLTLLGDATVIAPQTVIDLPFGTLAMPLAQDGRGRNLSVSGALTLNLRSLEVGGIDAPLTDFAGGRITAQGDLTITATEAVTARLLRGRSVTVTGQAPDPQPGVRGAPVNVAVREAVATLGAASLTATGNLRADRVTAAGDVTLSAGSPGVFGTLRALDVVSGATARLLAGGLVGAGPLFVTARTLTGDLGNLAAGQRLQLTQATVLQDFGFGTAFGPATLIRALAGGLSLRGAVRLGNTRIEALSLAIDGQVTGGDLDIMAINGATLAAGAQLQGQDVAIAVGGPLGGDFARRPADLVQHADSRITAFGALTLSATGEARITGLQSRRGTPGPGIDVSAARIVEAGDAWVDLTTGAGVTARLRADELVVDALTGLETQIGALDVVVGRGDILLREIDDLAILAARTGAGRIDIFSFGDALLVQGADDTLSAPDSVVVTAQGSLFISAPADAAVAVSARRLFLGAIDGTLGSQAAPVALTAGRQGPEALAVFAGRHVVGSFGFGPVAVALLAADTGLIEARFGAGSTPGIVSAAGPITADGLGPFRPLTGAYDTRPRLAAVLEAARYPVRLSRAGDGTAFDPTGLDAVPGAVLPPRAGGSDGATPPPGTPSAPDQAPPPVLIARDPTLAPADEVALRLRVAEIAAALRSGVPLSGAPATVAGNPLQPFGTLYNRLREPGPDAANDDEEAARRRGVRVTVSDDLRPR